jgi:hypothetical protein
MSFSFSTFTVEIDGVPPIAFWAKWYAEADDAGTQVRSTRQLTSQEDTRRGLRVE